MVAFPFRDGRGHGGPGRVLININAPYMAYTFNLLGRSFLADKHVTGYWAWELPRAPDAWRQGLRRVHALATRAPSLPMPCVGWGRRRPSSSLSSVMLEALPEPPPRARPISPEAPFTIAFSFNSASGFETEEPPGADRRVQGRLSRPCGHLLRILASNIEHYPNGRSLIEAARAGDPRIAVTFAAVDRDAYWRWYGRPDLYPRCTGPKASGCPSPNPWR